MKRLIRFPKPGLVVRTGLYTGIAHYPTTTSARSHRAQVIPHGGGLSRLSISQAFRKILEYLRLFGLAGRVKIRQGKAQPYRYSDQHVRLHIVPLCGNVKLSQLTTPIVEGYRDKLAAKLSRPMAIRVLRSLKAIIGESMRLGRVAQNVAAPVRMARAKRVKPKPVIPSKKALKAVLEAAKASDDPMALPLHCLAIFGGLRASELRGAAWPSLHLKSASIEVTQRADAKGKIGAPKSEAGHRVIPLPDMAMKALKAWKLACPVTNDNLIFPSLAGKVMSWNYMVDHVAGPVQVAAGEYDVEGKGDNARKVPRWGLHGFRHAAASLWIDQGVNPKRVQYLMGHSSIQVTFDTYGHLFEQVEKDTDTSAAIERAIFADAT